MGNEKLNKAKQIKNDEFYTQLSDIENELKNYKNHFKNKTIYCNCDNYEWSNFYKYFLNNFRKLKLKKLISTYYSNDGISYKMEIELDNDNNLIYNKTKLIENGDFRSEECIEILKEADIVVTNPPFSLFRDFVSLINQYNKQYLIVGNYGAIIYLYIFKLIKENKLWIGISPRSMSFVLPDGSLKNVNACWFTNLEHSKQNKYLELTKSYNELDYPKYDNYDAISVSKVKDIPMDYYENIGVPITFLEKYNSNQFELVHIFRPKLKSKDIYMKIIIKRNKNKRFS